MNTYLKMTLAALSTVLTLTLAQPVVAAPDEWQCQDLRALCAAGNQNACQVAARLCRMYPVQQEQPEQTQPMIFRLPAL